MSIPSIPPGEPALVLLLTSGASVEVDRASSWPRASHLLEETAGRTFSFRCHGGTLHIQSANVLGVWEREES